MTPTELLNTIRAEIERQMKYYEEKEMREWDEQNDEDALWYQGHRKMCSKLLSFLDTLPEQPASEGLEEEISSYWNRVTGFQPKFAVLELTKEELAKVARHFAEWGAKNAK